MAPPRPPATVPKPLCAGILLAAFVYKKTMSATLSVIAGLALACTVWLTKYLAEPVPPGQKRHRHPLEDWCAQYEEDAVEPEVAIFDPHHHLWDFYSQPRPSSASYVFMSYFKPQVLDDWVAKTNVALTNVFGRRSPFSVPYMAEEFLEDIRGNGKGHTVVGSVYIETPWEGKRALDECLRPVGEVAMATDVCCANPQICQGIVGHADLRLGAGVEPVLALYARNPFVKGIRHCLNWSEDPAIFSHMVAAKDLGFDAKFQEGFALLSQYNLSYDCWLYHPQLEALTELAKKFPATTIVCDHCGQPLGIGRRDRLGVFETWQDSMRLLAAEKNVHVKLSGLGMRPVGFDFCDRDMPPTSDELAEAWRPYIEFLLEVFGVDRCMFASNFPVDKISGSYTVYFNAFKKLVKGYSAEDKEKLFELNAKRVYRI